MTTGTEVFQLEPFLEVERQKVEEALERALGHLVPPLPEDLKDPVSHGVLAGGKRLRPILCATSFLTCCEEMLPDTDWSNSVYDLAVCLELIHAYSLMHDDLPCMDDAALRRGISTPHTVYGEVVTMRAGMVLIPLAGLQAWKSAGRLGLGPEGCGSVVRILSQAAGVEGMVGGQAMDLLGEGRALSREELDELHRKKTGALFRAAARLGAVAAGATGEVEEAFVRYGRAIGLAFQIADDVLDATADATALGKNSSDRDLDKSTYVRFLGVEAARKEAEALIEDSLRALKGVGIVSPPLAALAWYMVRRDH